MDKTIPWKCLLCFWTLLKNQACYAKSYAQWLNLCSYLNYTWIAIVSRIWCTSQFIFNAWSWVATINASMKDLSVLFWSQINELIFLSSNNFGYCPCKVLLCHYSICCATTADLVMEESCPTKYSLTFVIIRSSWQLT